MTYNLVFFGTQKRPDTPSFLLHVAGAPCRFALQAGAFRGRATAQSAKVPTAVASGAAKRSRGSAKDRKDACSDESEGGDDKDFFDANDVHDEDDDEDGDDDDDDEVEVTRVVATKGGTKKSGRGAAAGAGTKQGARNGAVAKKGFLLEVGCLGKEIGWSVQGYRGVLCPWW